MALSLNDPVDLFAQRRLDALTKTRDTARTRASDAATQRFSLTTQAATLRESRSLAAANAARTATVDRTPEKPAAPKPAPTGTEGRTKATDEKPPAPSTSNAPTAKPAAAKPATDAQAPTASEVKPAKNPVSAAAATEAATAGEAQATLVSSSDGLGNDAEDAEKSSASDEATPTTLLLGPPSPPPAALPGAGTPTPAEEQVSATAALATGAKTAIAVDGIVQDGQKLEGADASGASGFTAALADAGAVAPPSDPSLSRSGPSATAAPTHVKAEAPPPSGPPPVPIGQVPLTIGLRSLSGSSQFEIRLDPLELGRIDVKLDIDKDSGTVATRIVVERPETLALLQRDAGQLQQALTQAGLDTGAGGIDLSLRGDGANGGTGSGQKDGQARGSRPPFADATDARPTLDAVPLRSLRGIGSLDIRI